MQVQTHASPTDGGLLYANNGSVGLFEVSARKNGGLWLYANAAAYQLLECLIGKLDLEQCSNTLLLLNACGGFIKHQPFAFEECG
jgi:hypothetical protein